MKTIIRFSLMFLLAAGLIFMMAPTASAQTCQGDGKGFSDVDGDGLNDNARDDDGDGIPNGQDEDYLPPQDGSGLKDGNRYGFVDLDGDGLNDNARDDDGDGIPNGRDEDYVPSQDCEGAQNKMTMQQKNKGEVQEAFQNRIQTFQRTGTMSQVQTQAKGEGNGDGGGSENGGGDCDGTGPKGKGGGKK